MQERVNALSMLKKDTVGNIDMISAIVENRADLLYVDKECVLLREKGSGILQLKCENMKHFAKIESYLSHAQCIVVHDEQCRDALVEMGFKTDMGVYQCYYPHHSIEHPLQSDIRRLDSTYLKTITEHYHLMNNPDYISFLIESQGIYGLFVDEELVGFIGSHDDGSMGLLEIFDAYRGKGYATQLERFLINLKLSERKIPYCQVIVGNEQSMGLQKKLGMEISKNRVYWLDI